MESQKTQYEDPARSKQTKIIHFSSGETLELEDSEADEEQSSSTSPFAEPTERTRFPFTNLAILVGRVSLLTCDFLGARLAGALGLTAAKYQYAIDQYHHDCKKKSDPATDVITEGQTEAIHLPGAQNKNQYGATRDAGCPTDAQGSGEETHREHTGQGYHNKGYQLDEEYK